MSKKIKRITTRTTPTIAYRVCQRRCEQWLAQLRADLAEDVAAFFGDTGDEGVDPRKTVLCLEAVTPEDAASSYALTEHEIDPADSSTQPGQASFLINPLESNDVSPYTATQYVSCAVPSPVQRRRRRRRRRKDYTVPLWAKI